MPSKSAIESAAANPDRPGKTSGPWTIPAVYLLLFLLCITSYHGIRDNYLFNDDFSWLREARYEMSADNILTYRVVDFFRPLVNVSFYVIEHLSPGNIPLHYSLNLALHFLNCVLVFLIFRSLIEDRITSAAAAALFAVTSVHTGAVLWISARTTLLSSFFLMASIAVMVSPSGGKRFKPAISAVLYVLALSAKETAIAGLPIMAMIHFLRRRESRENAPGPAAVLAAAAVTIVYLIVRWELMGGYVRENWGPGLHFLRNAAGGFLYQIYVWPLVSLIPSLPSSIPAPTHPFIPEIAVVPAILLIIWIGGSKRKLVEMVIALGWTVLALLPAAAFRYRFFSTESITQNRYYYLSSAGSVLIIAILLSMLYRSGSRLLKTVSILVFILSCVGYIVRIDRLEKKWEHFTGMYEYNIDMILEEVGSPGPTSTLAIENPPLAFPYIEDALVLEHPGWRIVEITGGREEALGFRPCFYITYSDGFPSEMRIEKLL